MRLLAEVSTMDVIPTTSICRQLRPTLRLLSCILLVGVLKAIRRWRRPRTAQQLMQRAVHREYHHTISPSVHAGH